MRFLVDECLSVHLVDLLTAAGHDVTHVNDQGLSGRPDESVLARAATDNRILISADTDFPARWAGGQAHPTAHSEGYQTARPRQA